MNVLCEFWSMGLINSVVVFVQWLPTVRPPSLSRGTTATVRPRAAALHVRPSRNNVRPCNRSLSVDPGSI